jgi:ArsR family transcriptional regulator, arsenate/arsenite/antimonite-responsive transcriptional repressor
MQLAHLTDACQYRHMSKPRPGPSLGTQAEDASCCPPIRGQELSVADSERISAVFKALSDPVRLRLFSRIAAHAGGEACVCDIADVGVSQPTVSHHLKKLREAGLLTSERRGTWVYYAVSPSVGSAVSALLDLRT